MLARSIKNFLDAHHTAYRIFSHQRTMNIEQAAVLMGIPKGKILKVTILGDQNGLLMAVHTLEQGIDFVHLKQKLHRSLQLWPEFKVHRTFHDCETGSWPPFGGPYRLPMIIDKAIEDLDVIYFEAGSHQHMVQIAAQEYLALNGDARHLNFIPETTLCTKQATFQQTIVESNERSLAQYAFPDLPKTVKQFLQLALQHQHSPQELIELVTADTALGEQLLDYAQSSFLESSQQRPTSVAEVTDVLGFERVTHIALWVSMSRMFTLKKNPEFDFYAFWQHAFYCAAISERITALVAKQHGVEPHVGYLAGLFHNFGLLLFSQLFPPEHRLLQKWMRQNPQISIHILEQRLLGMGKALSIIRGGHAQLGERLLQHWNMPEIICTIAREHHTYAYEGEGKWYVNIIQLTNNLLRNHYAIGDSPADVSNERWLTALGLSEAVVVSELNAILDKEKTCEFWRWR